MKRNIIYGPPGTGKTTYLLTILEDQLKMYNPQEIAFVSFTKKGVNEGKERAMVKFNLSTKELVYFRTLHSMAFRECALTREEILGKRDYSSFSKQIGMKFLGYYTEDFFHNDDAYLFYNILKRNNEKEADKLKSDLNINTVKYVDQNYTKYKKVNGKYDFTDMIEKYLIEGKPVPVKVAIIDEAQDLTTLQWKMVEKAFSTCDRIFIAGDDDQAIYEWSGSDIRYFLSLKGNKKILNKSYRLPSNILDFSKQFIEEIKNRVKKEYSPIKEGGKISYYTSLAQVEYNKDESWLLLARNNYTLNKYVTDLSYRKYIYYHKGKSSINKRDLNQIAEYEKIRHMDKPLIKGDAEIILRKCLRLDINLKNPWYYNFNWKKEKILYYQDIFTKGLLKDNKYRININTIHGVKGGEADNIVLNLDTSKAITKNLETNLDAELRCLYVACTRAKKSLHIVYNGGKHNYEKIIKRN